MGGLRPSRVFWIGAAALLVAAALVALGAVVRGSFSDTEGRILGTLGAALLAGSAVVAGLTLVDRGARALGWACAAISLPAFALVVYAIWDFVFDGGGDSWRWGWLGILALVAALIAATARLIARSPRIVPLAGLAGFLAALAAAVSVAVIWQEDPGDAIAKTLAVLWILAGLAYLLVPVLERFSSAGAEHAGDRVLGAFDGLELVAGAEPGGEVVVELAGRSLLVRRDGDETRLAPGERLALRSR
jgi:hypothetical protein